ncbi:MAG: acetoin utilization protein AcuC [Planctomycetota bacterium]
MSDALLVDALALPVYDLGDAHPFAPFRQQPLFDLLRAHRLFDDHELLIPHAASDEELTRIHDPGYVRLLERLDDPEDHDAIRLAPVYGMGTSDNPICRGQHASAAAAVGGTLACMRAVLEGRARAAFNSTGGLHHAMPGAASGFCLYNDLAVAIDEALRSGFERVAYIDFDVHHGDGVEWIFREDPRVLTISLHETPDTRWPFTGRVTDRGRGRGEGFAINLPFAPGTCDRSWTSIARDVLGTALTRFAPQVLVTQHGCDPHHSDPLADLSLTTSAFASAAMLSRELADSICEGRWVATGGGGYQPVTVIPRAWSMVWCAVSGRPIPDAVDEGWRARWQARSRDALPRRFLDDRYEDPREEQAARSNAAMRDALRRVNPQLCG